MRLRLGVLSLVTSLLVLSTSAAYAQCSKDTDCKGDRVCDAGKCVALPPAPPPPPGTEAAPAAAPAPAPAAAPAPAPSVVYVPVAPAAPAAPAPAPKMKRNSPGMMVGGIIMVAVSPFMFAAAIANSVCTYELDYDGDPYDCNNGTAAAGFTIAGVALLGVGIPLIVIGAKRVPADSQAQIRPWLSPNVAGAKLELEL